MTRAFCVLLSLLGMFITGCSELSANEAPDASMDNPDATVYNRCADPEERARIIALYESEMTQDQLSPPLSEAGIKWAMDHQSAYEKAFIFARCLNTEVDVPVLVNYYGGIGSRVDFFKEAWTLEREELFRQLMQSLMREVFPGYNFVLTFNHEEPYITAEEAAIIIHLAYDPDRYSYAIGKEVYLIHPTIIGHEAGHLCPDKENANGFCTGFSHHYPGDDYRDHSQGPPEEDEGTCIMYRNGATYGRTESDVALLNYQPGAEERALSLITQIRAMLPDQMNAHAEIDKCGTIMEDLVLTNQ